ncbi:MAG: ureidoglycolate lyase [Hyphomicrobiaceae bacterium]|jgi:ureidoglycolate lyase
MRTIKAEPLTAAAFAPFGDVLEAPAAFGRVYCDAGLANGRADARPSLSIAHVKPVEAVPLKAVMMERHEFSSQSFIPLDPVRYIVLVAPKAADGGPDLGAARAFLATGQQGITYRMDVWHHPMTVLDRPARFAIVMWLDGGNKDEEFVQLAVPVEIALAG